LNDEVAIDLALKIVKATKAQLGDAGGEPAAGGASRRHGRAGRAPRPQEQKGFYDYPENGPKRLWPGSPSLQPKHLEAELLSMDDLKARLLVTQALEGARTVEEGVITDPREAMWARSWASASRPSRAGR
jgi:3-hydroxyacyl-CoA dehydrogenase/enoyl-CoA hydratase/3-hydroxybutyryl-CoA epimerase